MESSLRKALALLRKPNPDHQAVLAHLTTAQAPMSAAALNSEQASPLLRVLMHMVATVRSGMV